MFPSIQKWLAKKRPRAFILENVKNLTTGRHKWFFRQIINSLRGIKAPANRKKRTSSKRAAYYHVTYKVLNSKDFGVPQARQRFMVEGGRALIDRC